MQNERSLQHINLLNIVCSGGAVVIPDRHPLFLGEAASEVLPHAGLQPFHVLDDHGSEVLKEGPVELSQSHCRCWKREGGGGGANTVEPPNKGHYGTNNYIL